ncbi:MAG: hypothetical protein ACI9MR_003931, partial [Myxococcota bacterium]
MGLGVAAIVAAAWLTTVYAEAPTAPAGSAVHRVKAGGGIYGDAKDPLTQKGQDAIQRKRFGRRHTPSPII